ncbi:hypothetical protein BRN48_10865 [Xanthomonas oryzae pv. oryzae]|nr:hypothetical protein BRN08_05460 [Xanthomonas oryzae pv. oryzae]RBK81742.1 hypothetical protein BRN48_10865 [Xanthomonas oryzae pv. oryzae]
MARAEANQCGSHARGQHDRKHDRRHNHPLPEIQGCHDPSPTPRRSSPAQQASGIGCERGVDKSTGLDGLNGPGRLRIERLACG